MVRRSDRSGYLVDTHVFIWAVENSPRLAQEHREILSRGERIYVSPVVVWEIEAKAAKGRLRLAIDIDTVLRETDCIELAVTWEHVKQLRSLPPIHRDPFDRMLVAQATVERLVILTSDHFIRQYPIEVI